MHPYNVIVKPVLSEKSNDLRENDGKYAFIVRREATKQDVKKAVAAMWDVEVKSVRTLVQRGKIKRRGMNLSKPVKTKKAFVTLAGDAKLPLFED
jgi:large subunit ribosomal protein L23